MAEPRIAPARQVPARTSARTPVQIDARIEAREVAVRRLRPVRGHPLTPAEIDARIARRSEEQVARRRP